MSTGAVILAAGISSRMKQFKPMMCVGQKPMIRCAVDILLKAKVSPIVVVTGYRAEQIERCLSGLNVSPVLNRKFASSDMFCSLKLGIRELEGKCSRTIIMPVDIPLVSGTTIRKLLAADGLVVKPCCGGIPGHPLVIASELFGEIERYDGENGLRGMLERLKIDETLVPTDDEGVLLDANTYEDYQTILAAEAKKSGKGTLHLDCNISLSVSDTIMDNEIMLLLEMIMYTGSIQMASECINSSYAKSWRQIKNIENQLGIPVVVSTAGGTKGGGTQLTEDGKQLLEAYDKLQTDGSRMLRLLFNEQFSEFLVQN